MAVDSAYGNVIIPEETLQHWQGTMDLLAEVAAVPAALIMRIRDQDIEVFVASRSEGNPYRPEDREHLVGSGLYCEQVISSDDMVQVTDALADPEWRENPDIALGMISYLGYPLHFPDGRTFGTICVLDRQSNAHSDTVRRLVDRFRDLIEHTLALSHMNHVLREENRSLADYIQEIKVLRGLVPICSFCKNIRDKDGQWHPVEDFVTETTEAVFSHTYCEACLRENFTG